MVEQIQKGSWSLYPFFPMKRLAASHDHRNNMYTAKKIQKPQMSHTGDIQDARVPMLRKLLNAQISKGKTIPRIRHSINTKSTQRRESYGSLKQMLNANRRISGTLDFQNKIFVKWLLYLLNPIILSLGITIMATGLYALSGDSLWGSIFFSSRITYHLINVLTLIGIYTMFLGFLGFWGTREKNTMLMSLYFLMLMVLFFFTITAIIVYYNKYSSKLSDVEESLSNYGNKTEQGLITTGAWNAIQTLFRCCGIKSIEDWTRHNVKKPPSPCSKSIQVQGCEMVLAPFLNGFSSIAINLLILEVLLLGAAAVALYKPLGQSTDEQWVELQEEKPIEKKKSNNFYPAYDDVRDMSAHSVVTDANKFESVRSNFSVQANKRRSNSSFYDEFVDAASRSSRSPRSKSSIAYDIADDTGTRLGKNKRSQNSSVYNKPAGSGTTTSGSYPLSNYIEAISGYAAASSLMKNNPLHDLMNTEQKNKYHYQPRTTKSFTTGETTSSSRPNMAKRTSSLTDVYTVLNVLEAMSSSKMFRT